MNIITTITKIKKMTNKEITLIDGENNTYYTEEIEKLLEYKEQDKILIVGKIKEIKIEIKNNQVQAKPIIEIDSVRLYKKYKELDAEEYTALPLKIYDILDKIGQKQKITLEEKHYLEKLTLTPNILIKEGQVDD